MNVIHLQASEQTPIADLCLCLGFFDGMHLAHRRLFEVALETAKTENVKTGIMTFSTNILSYIKSEAYDSLTQLTDKIERAKISGFDYFFVLEVDSDLISLSPAAFIDDFLASSRKLVVGFDYTFGKFGRGDVKYLEQKLPGKTIVVPELKYYGKKIGSRRIRELLSSGRIELANRLLGNKYAVKGRVIKGKGRGRLLGYPTANIDYNGYFLPKIGVYHTLIRVDGLIFDAMTNVGKNPTFNGEKITLETHVFGIDERLYDKEMEIIFESFIREERRFSSKEALIEQLHDDEKLIKEIIKSRRI